MIFPRFQFRNTETPWTRAGKRRLKSDCSRRRARIPVEVRAIGLGRVIFSNVELPINAADGDLRRATTRAIGCRRAHQLSRQYRRAQARGVTILFRFRPAARSRRSWLPAPSCCSINSSRTHVRASSFFGAGCVAHVSMAHPVSPRLQHRASGHHHLVTVVCDP